MADKKTQKSSNVKQQKEILPTDIELEDDFEPMEGMVDPDQEDLDWDEQYFREQIPLPNASWEWDYDEFDPYDLPPPKKPATTLQFEEDKQNYMDHVGYQRNLIEIASKCFDKCVPFPNTKLSGGQQRCIYSCASKFFQHQAFIGALLSTPPQVEKPKSRRRRRR